MDPHAAFPIMMGSCAFLMPICSVRFIRAGKYNVRAAIGLAIGAVPGVLIAAYLVTRLDIKYLYWLVMIVALYASLLMLYSARKREPLAEKAIAS